MRPIKTVFGDSGKKRRARVTTPNEVRIMKYRFGRYNAIIHLFYFDFSIEKSFFCDAGFCYPCMRREYHSASSFL